MALVTFPEISYALSAFTKIIWEFFDAQTAFSYG